MHWAIHVTYLSYKTSENIWYDFEIPIKIKHDIFKMKKKMFGYNNIHFICASFINIVTCYIVLLINIRLSSLNSKYTIVIISKCAPRKIN